MRVDFTPSEALYPFESRWFESPVGPVHYLDEGAGRAIVLMHGNPTWSFLYRELIPLLRAGGLRCIAMDLVGHGLSAHPDGFGYTGAEQAAVVAALIRHLDVSDYVLLGQDWGGPIGLCAAALDPDRVGAVVLGYTFAWPQTNAFVWLIAKALSTAWGQRFIAREAFTAKVMRALLKTRPGAEELEHWTAVHPTPAHRRSLQMLPRELLNTAWLAELECSLRARLSAKPALLFHSGLDEWLLGRPTARFAGLFRQHQIVPLPRGAGHFFQLDRPREVAAALLDFLAAAPAGPGAEPFTVP